MARRQPPGPSTRQEEAVWRALVRAVIVIPRLIEADLVASSSLNLADYTVIAILSEKPTRSTRMGLTRVVDRLAADGLVERRRSRGDGRGKTAHLTDLSM